MLVLETVRATIGHHAMLARGDRVVVAVSGGADSVALLHVLHALASELDLTLSVAHVDHRLREDSGDDAAFVRALGARLGVPVEVVAVDVARRGSLEDAARRARYAALAAAAARAGATRIAVGHTADDQAETLLLRLLEGAGPRGLAGIPPVRGRIVRPLIACLRRDLVAMLAAVGEGWREDPSNRDLKFARNRVRHEVLPLLAAAFDGDVVSALAAAARRLRETVEAVASVGRLTLERWMARGEGIADDGAIVLPLRELRALPRPVAGEVLRQAAASLGSRAPFRAWVHRGLDRVLAPAPPRPFRFGGLTLEASGAWLRLASRPAPALAPRVFEVPGTLALEEIGAALEARVQPAAGYVVPRQPAIAAFDADGLPPRLEVRARRAGDRFTAFGGGERRVKACLIGARVPRWERGRVPLVAADGVILWLAGLRRAAAAPVTPATRRVLELRLVQCAGL
ncbi:MAG: tRNA lysidine(34) synthetase TilS [Candidatus Rokubacteria bacterium]|nr:tRNA lysidine(34) synthetase TilS [Candidatus Rokubacteria bacterium]